ncbi:MAG: PAS domain S-box protein [Clostridiales bacterium]|nr:PAS domain S-box protein [Clostridiales bacterium]
MDIKRIESFKEFAGHLEYPMVIFEAESGKVLEINAEAKELIGDHVKHIHIEPGRSLTKLNFWEMLHDRKSLMWHRIRMVADNEEHLVCGLVNEATVNEQLIYTVLFERRADLNIGSFTLERIVNHAGIVAFHMACNDGKYQIEYVSRNIRKYGYTRGQFYDNVIDVKDIVCPEDYEKVSDTIAYAAKKHIDEGALECRIFTDERDLIPVRLQIHYIYNEEGMLTDFEILMMDMREELQRNSENAYLSNAVTKMKSVVLVKSYHAGKRTLKYISPNAGMVGMNVEALRKGYKLTEDYIHPDDRDGVIDSIYQAVANGVTDYLHTYRMVRDDGRVIWVENVVTINRVSDGEADVCFLLTDVTEQKNMEQELAATAENELTATEIVSKPVFHNVDAAQLDKEMLKQFELMAQTLSQNVSYYSVVVDTEGALVTTPAGPGKDIGQFYDLFERPQMKEEFVRLSGKAKEELLPQSASLSMNKMNVHMVFAPLTVQNEVMAYWVLTSFAKDGDVVIGSVIEQQWQLANAIAKCFYAEEAVTTETRLRKLTEIQLHKEQQERHVLQDMIDIMVQQGEAGLGEICQKAALYLNISDIGIYVENKETEKVEKYFSWDLTSDNPAFFDVMAMSVSEYKVLHNLLKDDKVVTADSTSTNLFLSELIRQTDMGNILFQAIEMADGIDGYVVFADKDKTHVFDRKDKHFIMSVTEIFGNIIFGRNKSSKTDILKEGVLDAYDHIRDAVFVKDNRTGDVIFANKAMDKLFGYSVVGMSAGDVVNDKLEQYRNMQGVRKRFITNKKVTKWQSYLKELDQIMNIVEVRLDLSERMDCSIYILKKNKKK